MGIPSPYTPGSTATFTPGRERYAATHQRLLVEVAGTRRFQGRIHVVHGGRGIGKTSLLRATERHARRLGLSTVFVTASADGCLSVIAEGLQERMSGLSPGSSSDRFSLSISTLGVKLGPAEIEVGIDDTPKRVLGAVAGFKHALAEVAQCTEGANTGLVVFLDEMQDAPAADLRIIATAWQELDAQVKQDGESPVPAAIIGAGLSNTPEVITAAASFGERIHFARLSNLPGDAAAQALIQPAIEVGVAWDPQALGDVLDRSGGYPYFLQLHAHEVWQMRTRHGGDRISRDDAGEGIAAVAEQVETFYRGRWNRATPAEQKVLATIAESGREEMKRTEIAAALGVRSSDLGVARASLMGKGLLTAPRRGVLAFNAPGFGAFILDEIEG